MSDLALVWDADAFAGDLLLTGGQLATDDGLRTAILISLFTDARAPEDAELPERGDDRRGWWGDAFAADAGPQAGSADDPQRIGSLLWLLARAKVTSRNLLLARQSCDTALAWLVRDGIASAVRVVVEAQVPGGGFAAERLAIAVELDRPEGPGRRRFDFTWDASTGAVGMPASGDPAP